MAWQGSRLPEEGCYALHMCRTHAQAGQSAAQHAIKACLDSLQLWLHKHSVTCPEPNPGLPGWQHLACYQMAWKQAAVQDLNLRHHSCGTDSLYFETEGDKVGGFAAEYMQTNAWNVIKEHQSKELQKG